MPSTGTGYETRVIAEKFGEKIISEISQFELEKRLISLKPGYKGTTINHFIKRLKAIFARAVKAGYVDKNPAEEIGRVEEIKVIKRRLSPEREAAILAACEDPGFDYVRQAVIILLETGMRPKELFRMERRQVLLSQGVIIAISYKGRKGLQPAEPKERAIPLTDRARAEFELLMLLPGERLYPYGDIKKSWEKVREHAAKESKDPELAGFWLRWCRDEAENRWREAGMHPLDIALLMGHSSPKTTRIYNNPRFSLLRSQMQSASGLPQEAGGKLIRLPVSG